MKQNVQLMKSKEAAILSDEHAASSYGQPVLVWRGQAYGPGDSIPSRYISDSDIGPLREQGESAFCYALPDASEADRNRITEWNYGVRSADEAIPLW
jgi:hypothetical protein